MLVPLKGTPCPQFPRNFYMWKERMFEQWGGVQNWTRLKWRGLHPLVAMKFAKRGLSFKG